jgi:hypothetical protein
MNSYPWVARVQLSSFLAMSPALTQQRKYNHDSAMAMRRDTLITVFRKIHSWVCRDTL